MEPLSARSEIGVMPGFTWRPMMARSVRTRLTCAETGLSPKSRLAGMPHQRKSSMLVSSSMTIENGRIASYRARATSSEFADRGTTRQATTTLLGIEMMVMISTE
jgi:hypothetical protein